MLGKFYDAVLDVELYRQMADLIYRLSEVKEKEQLSAGIKRRALFPEKPELEMEEAYGLRYPGEVLERLHEKEAVTERQLRALGLALAQTKALQNDGMFIGKQMPSFWKRMKRALKPTDLYWVGIQYLMGDYEKSEHYGTLLDFPVQSIEELVFILSLLPENAEVWEAIKGKLDRLLGKERNCSAYTHAEIYAWLTTHYHSWISGYRKKDIETLKYLMRLPFSYAKEGSTSRKKLMEAGYSVQEIMYLSMYLLYQVNAYDLLKKEGLTAERMAVETCMLFLSGKGELLDQAGELCSRLLKEYRRFEVRLENTTGIFERLYGLLKVENVKTYQILLLNDDLEYRHGNWFMIDLTDSKWEGVYSLIGRNSFDRWVFETLSEREYSKEETKQYLCVYQDLTGEDFIQHFWKIDNSCLYFVFPRLAKLGLVQPLDLLSAYLEEYQSDPGQADEKWRFMTKYLKSFMDGLENPEAVEMLFQIEKTCGISGVDLLSAERVLLKSVGIESRYMGLYFDGMDLIRPFLSIEGHRRLFSIVEQHILKEHPDKYISFVMEVVSAEDNFAWLPKEEARNIFLKLAQMPVSQSQLDELRKIYLTEEDFEVIKAERKEKEKRRLLLEQMNTVRDIRKSFSLYVAKIRKTEDQFEKLWDYVQSYGYNSKVKKEKLYITKRYLCSLFQKEAQIILKKKEIENLCGLVQLLFTEAELTFLEMREILDHVELQEEGLDAVI